MKIMQWIEKEDIHRRFEMGADAEKEVKEPKKPADSQTEALENAVAKYIWAVSDSLIRLVFFQNRFGSV